MNLSSLRKFGQGPQLLPTYLYGREAVFGPAVLLLPSYVIFSKPAPGAGKPKGLGDYATLLRDMDAPWFSYKVRFAGLRRAREQVGALRRRPLWFGSRENQRAHHLGS